MKSEDRVRATVPIAQGNRGSDYPYRMGAIGAAFVFLFSLPVAVTVFGPGTWAITSSIAAAFLGFATITILITKLGEIEWTAHQASPLESFLTSDQVLLAIASAQRSLDWGIAVAALSAVLTGVAFLLILLVTSAIAALDLLALVVSATALFLAIRSYLRLKVLSSMSLRTVWHRALRRVGIFGFGAAILTATTGLTALINLFGPHRLFVNDWAAFMTALFALYLVIDARAATLIASATPIPNP